MSVCRLLLAAASAAALVVPLTVAVTGIAGAEPADQGIANHAAHVCATPAVGHVACGSLVVVDPAGKPKQTSEPTGYTPAQLRGAYGLDAAASSKGSGMTVAIVDAYDDPNALADVNVYRGQWGIAPFGSDEGPTFTKVGQDGNSSLPAPNASWAQEISLDLDMVSAICPNCNVVLVEANSASYSDLAAAVNTAVVLGADAISNSYGGPELDPSTASDIAAAYDHPGVAITASSGDSGYGVSSPASFATVTAVGGTTLQINSNNSRGSETAWNGAGSGCSAYSTRPDGQTGSIADTNVCAHRVVADVSAVADPATGVAVYDTYGLGRNAGWLTFGGTSVGAPIIAAIYALAGGNNAAGPSGLYASATSTDGTYSGVGFNDVVSGSNGSCPADTTSSPSGNLRSAGAAGAAPASARSEKSGKPGGGPGKGGSTPPPPNTYLCEAAVGFDGPTGLGSPSGIGAF
jgi:subtilase family serine protease